jgi:hypothetical protein
MDRCLDDLANRQHRAGAVTPSTEQRQRLVVRLFSACHGNVADTASLRGAFADLARRGFRGS